MDDLMTTVDVGRLAGVGPTAVKRWADEGLLPCVRTAGGHRRFPRADVERFLKAQRSPSTHSLVDLLLRTEGLGVEARLLAERGRLGSWLPVAESLAEVLAEIGLRWRAGTITVIQEHLASERLARALARLVEAMPLAPGAPRCVLACAEGDDHALGLSLVEICLREAGWATLWSGRRTPAADIAEMVRAGDAEMVAISASAASTDAEVLRRELEVVGPACTGSGTALALGGDGAWPDPPGAGRRFYALAPFASWARELARSRNGWNPDAP
jgi:MerR family transcriptional regulator, light-induced transcriptional regulator